VDVLDVGQGDSILIRTPANKAILIDASDNQAKVPALLTSLGVTSLDLVIATHPHADHIGGMDEVLDAFPVKNYLDNGLPHTTATYEAVMSRVEAKKIPYKTGLTGMSFNLDDGAVLEILFPNGVPLKDTRSDLNSNSVVARLTHGDDCFLFTGDAEEPTERALLAAGLAQCDVLKVAHHGSNHSSTAPFLAAVKPSIAVISVGTGNRYGHPGEETLGRIAGTGAAIYRTDLMGTVTLLSDGKKIKVEAPRGLGAGRRGRIRRAPGVHAGRLGPRRRAAHTRRRRGRTTERLSLSGKRFERGLPRRRLWERREDLPRQPRLLRHARAGRQGGPAPGRLLQALTPSRGTHDRRRPHRGRGGRARAWRPHRGRSAHRAPAGREGGRPPLLRRPRPSPG